jgi:predicted peptidase
MSICRRLSSIPAFLGAAFTLACRSTSAEPPAGQSAQSFEGTVTKKVGYRYLLYLPKAYAADPSRRWPFLLFLHGSGERGEDLSKVKVHGPPKLLDGRDDFPFVVVSPQCPAGERWNADALAALLDDVTRRLRVDPDRVSATGMSMGGRGTWDLAMTYPERFAAIVPVCGGALPDRACRLKDVPVKAFHGAKDTTVPLAESETVVAAVRACGGTAELTVYPEAGHDSWTATYADESVWTWLLAQRRHVGGR